MLNRSWRPVNTTSVRHAIAMVYQRSARIVDPTNYQTFDFESWRDAASFARRHARQIRGCGWSMRAPEVIVLARYDGNRTRRVKVNRRNLFLRDHNTCQYCARRARTQDLTIDHVIPRSRGGTTCWENLVVACFRCNQRKGNRNPSEAGMRLLRNPKRPSPQQLALQGLSHAPLASWEAFLSELYWDQELRT